MKVFLSFCFWSHIAYNLLSDSRRLSGCYGEKVNESFCGCWIAKFCSRLFRVCSERINDECYLFFVTWQFFFRINFLFLNFDFQKNYLCPFHIKTLITYNFHKFWPKSISSSVHLFVAVKINKRKKCIIKFNMHELNYIYKLVFQNITLPINKPKCSNKAFKKFHEIKVLVSFQP